MADVFLSYRRKDATAHALLLRLALARELGEPAVFLDASSIAPGAQFPAELAAALDSAQVVLALIGPGWDAARLADDADWVRRELERALARGVHLVPVLVGGAAMPTQLPPSLAALASRQAHVLGDATLASDVAALVDHVRAHFGLAAPAAKPGAVLPTPPVHVPQKLTADELKNAMSMLPEWALEKSALPGKPSAHRTELTRAYRFESFLDAIDFMSRTAKHIDDDDHHPRWENLWKTITVWLSTWDIGHEVSDRDIRLARYLDKAFADATAPKRRRS